MMVPSLVFPRIVMHAHLYKTARFSRQIYYVYVVLCAVFHFFHNLNSFLLTIYIGALDRFRIVLHAFIYDAYEIIEIISKLVEKFRISTVACTNIGYMRNGPNFRRKKCTLDSLLVQAPLHRFRTQVHAPQCEG